jgi:hypothetical protein
MSGKAILAIIGGILAMVILGNVLGSNEGKRDNHSSSSSRSSTATATTPAGPKKPDATFSMPPGPQGDAVLAVFDIGDNFTSGLRRTGAQMHTVDILEYAAEMYPNASQVTIQGMFPTKDAYGNSSNSRVPNVTYLRSTLDKINFAGVDSDRIWGIRDSGTIHPELQ